MVSLPLYPRMGDRDVEDVIEAVCEVVEKRKSRKGKGNGGAEEQGSQGEGEIESAIRNPSGLPRPAICWTIRLSTNVWPEQ